MFVLRQKEDETKKPQKPRHGTLESGFCTAAGENKETVACSTQMQTIDWEKNLSAKRLTCQTAHDGADVTATLNQR